jgi:prepilin-type N-terminal cleavage/methylation domain-containing protein
MESSLQNNKGMTFIEMLVVMGIISILFASFFYIWNTMDIFRKSRDSKRINDLQLLDTALKTLLSTERNINLGQENVIYTSLPDSSSTCGSYNLIPLFSPYSYRCQTSQNYLKVDGNGWLPVNFTLGKILMVSVLPIDPLNNKDYFYAYQVRQGRYKLTARFETQTNISKMANDGGFEPTLYEVGSDLFIPSPHSGLVGYWSFDEGTGTIAYDLSGYGNNGTLNNFNFTATSGWTTGKIGKALIFDGVNDYVSIPDNPSLDINQSITVIAYVYPTAPTLTYFRSFVSKYYTVNQRTYQLNVDEGYTSELLGQETFQFWISCCDGVTRDHVEALAARNVWQHVSGVYDYSTRNLAIYVNGEPKQKKTTSIIGIATNDLSTYPLAIGATSNGTAIQNVIQGIIDEIRIYNRALSDSEIKYLYEATR